MWLGNPKTPIWRGALIAALALGIAFGAGLAVGAHF